MAYETSSIDATLSAAAGANPQLQAELKAAFLVSVDRQIDLMSRARCDGNWQMAAMRLRAIAASFHADELIELANEATSGAPGDPRIITTIKGFANELRNPV